MDEQFDDHYILIEQEDLVLELEFIVTSNSQGISLSINPKGDAISRGNGDDVRLVGLLYNRKTQIIIEIMFIL